MNELYSATDAPLRRAVTRRLAEIAREAGREHGTQSAKDGPLAGFDDQTPAECGPAVVPEF